VKKEGIYLDSSVPSAYFDTRVPWRMEYTQQWWHEELPKYTMFISTIVIVEIQRTKDENRRDDLLRLVLDFPQLELSNEIEDIARGYVNHKIIPPSAFADAIHIAIASFYKIDFLVTWNCEHLAEAHRRRKIRLFNTIAGLYVPEIGTPMELKISQEGDENGI
jgi:predicted nucleic acid-binding protein